MKTTGDRAALAGPVPGTTSGSRLEVDAVSKRYGDVVALDRLSISLGPGEICGFVGPNGAGKTTTMRIITGLLTQDEGEVRWNGRRIDGGMRRQIGYMPEERGLYPKMRVGRQLRYFGELHGVEPRVAAARTTHWLNRLAVGDRSGDRVEALSLGNQQRVQLAASLVFDPALLILDEPFSGLDPIGVEALSSVLAEVSRERGVPVLFSSHQLDLVERFCDTVVIIRSGRLIAAGGVGELERERSPNRWRLELGAGDPDWDPHIPGATRVAPWLFDLEPRTDPQLLLKAGQHAGTVVTFGRERFSLTELFRDTIEEAA